MAELAELDMTPSELTHRDSGVVRERGLYAAALIMQQLSSRLPVLERATFI